MELVLKWCFKVEAFWLGAWTRPHEGGEGKKKDCLSPEGPSCLVMRSSLAGCRSRRDIPEPIWANGDLPVGLCQHRSTQKLLPAASHMSCLHARGTTMNQMVCPSWRWFTEGDGQASPKLQLTSCGKRCAWIAVCGTFIWLLSPQACLPGEQAWLATWPQTGSSSCISVKSV